MPSSVTTTSVSGSIRASVSGSPISLLKPASAATTRTCGRSSAVRMSFVDVFPTEPVIATTRAPLRARTALPIAAIAAKPSSGTSVAAAPRSRASSRNDTPPPSATKRSPGDTRRESISTPVTSSAVPSRRPRPRSSASGSGIRFALRVCAGPRAPTRDRRTEQCDRRIPVLAPRPSRRSGRRLRPARARSHARSRTRDPARPRRH